MKKITVMMSIATLSMLIACGNSSKQSVNNDDQTITVSEKITNEKVSNLQTKEGFEKMLKDYKISIYSNAKFKDIKKKGNGDFVITYIIDDLSSASHEKVKKYIAKAFANLKENGWGTEPSFHIAMKKEGDYKVGIEINEVYVTSLKLHKLIISYGITN